MFNAFPPPKKTLLVPVAGLEFLTVHFEVAPVDIKGDDEMNIKPAHLRKDSNPYRQKKNAKEKHQMKENFTKSDLINIPEGTEVLNEKIYFSLVENLDELGLGLHLKKIDVTTLVAVANTMEIIADAERNMKKIGNFQKIVTREGYEKWVATPFAQMRSTNLNLLQSQLKQLQLDPQSRQLLQESVLNDINMVDDSIDENDDLMNSILERIG